MIAQKLNAAIAAVCPIHGVSIGVSSGRVADKATWRIDFKDEATTQQKAAAQAALEAFDPADPKIEAVETITKMEASNPITHRALREFFLGFGEAQPAFKDTLLYKRVKAVDDAIRAERAKL